jgi:dihydropteroate synthase
MKLVEPLALLRGANATEALRQGYALPLMGGPAAFTLARLHDGRAPPILIRAPDVPPPWRDALARVTARPPAALLPEGALVMSILNATPDSFSDAGCHLDPAAGIAAGEQQAADGAAIIDIGGESTRPGATPPPVAEEIRRILPLIEGLKGRAILSVDTRRSPVMAAALDAGADLINDVSALAFDPAAIPLLAPRTCAVALMHMRGTPETMQTLTRYGDIAVDVTVELAHRIQAALDGGIDKSRLLIDPGIGFAKTAPQNLELLRRLPILANLGCRILLGVSRKSFIGRLAHEPAPDRRTPGSLAAAADALALPGLILRVHDVRATVQFTRVLAGLS